MFKLVRNATQERPTIVHTVGTVRKQTSNNTMHHCSLALEAWTSSTVQHAVAHTRFIPDEMGPCDHCFLRARRLRPATPSADSLLRHTVTNVSTDSTASAQCDSSTALQTSSMVEQAWVSSPLSGTRRHPARRHGLTEKKGRRS